MVKINIEFLHTLQVANTLREYLIDQLDPGVARSLGLYKNLGPNERLLGVPEQLLLERLEERSYYPTLKGHLRVISLLIDLEDYMNQISKTTPSSGSIERACQGQGLAWPRAS